MANETRESLEKRVRKALFQEAIFRPESAIVIAATMLVTTASAVFPNFVPIVPAWGWLLGGLVAEGALVGVALTDPEFGRRVAAKVLRHDYQPERLKDKYLQQRMAEALDYRSRIEAAVRQRSDTVLRDELIETTVQIDEWLENIYDLALRIDRYQDDAAVLERDRKRAETRLYQLQHELSATQDTAVREQLSETIEGLQQQLQSLNALESTIQRARLQLENSLTHLGTIYSQTMLVDVKDIDRARAKRLRQEISDEVTELNDLLSSMDDVYSAEAF
jgi:predicted translin family RNA/ssDNA-binding protein